MPIDHCGVFVPTSKATEANEWYEKALKPLGYTRQHSELDGKVIGYGVAIHAMDLWVIATSEMPDAKMHVALRAEGKSIMRTQEDRIADRVHLKDRTVVDEFHKAAVAAGGKDNGAPGLRPYGPHYYAAFVYDPAGNNIEVVCRQPTQSS